MGNIRIKRYSTKRKSRNNSNKRKSRKEKNYKKSRKNSTKRKLRKQKTKNNELRRKRFKSVKRGGAPDDGGDGDDALVRARAADPRDYPPPQDGLGPPGLAPAGGFRLLPQGGQVGEAARRQAAMRAAAAGRVAVFDDGGPRPMDVCEPGEEEMVPAKADDGSVNPDEYN
jgi:hypothetical protein